MHSCRILIIRYLFFFGRERLLLSVGVDIGLLSVALPRSVVRSVEVVLVKRLVSERGGEIYLGLNSHFIFTTKQNLPLSGVWVAILNLRDLSIQRSKLAYSDLLYMDAAGHQLCSPESMLKLRTKTRISFHVRLMRSKSTIRFHLCGSTGKASGPFFIQEEYTSHFRLGQQYTK